jgi:hypothetical protein
MAKIFARIKEVRKSSLWSFLMEFIFVSALVSTLVSIVALISSTAFAATVAVEANRAAPPVVSSLNSPLNSQSQDTSGGVAPAVSVVPVKAIYVSENQPVQIVDAQGRLLQVIYLKRTK